ncbi:exodeoxyribonuclease III [Flavobacteriaceae bacterium Ap0902]|nr:exodeoxyribonuclease III [Flavobacteriaceae bacterium Ap0902]
MKIISYNVNGIRAAIKKGLLDWLETASPDILCLQETKAIKEQVNLDAIEEKGYHAYWNSAERKGYSGVAIFTRKKPMHVEYDTGIESLDGEGRVMRVDFDDVSVISLYLPNGGGSIERLDYKMKFCYDFTQYIYDLQKTHSNLVVCGDYNICHKPIDIHDPIRNANVSGFLPIEREWLTEYIEECKMIDSFRVFNQQPGQYTWWSYRARSRERNKGWRLDYHMVTEKLRPNLKRCVHLTEVKHSDHCPILLELE